MAFLLDMCVCACVSERACVHMYELDYHQQQMCVHIIFMIRLAKYYAY